MLSIKQAKEILNNATKDQKTRIQDGYDKYVHEISEACLEERSSIAHLIKLDCFVAGLEDELWTEETFLKLWDSIEIMDLRAVAVS